MGNSFRILIKRISDHVIPARTHFLFIIFSSCVFFSALLAGCASSNVSRDVSAEVDRGVHNAKGFANLDSSPADSFANASQATKGALIGGSAGAVTSLFSGTAGFFPWTAAGAIMGASYGAYIDSNTSLEDKLINRGASVVVLGDQVLIALPSARIFNPYTSTVKTQAYSTLALLAEYLNQYTTMLIKISVYTNDTGSKQVDLALSQQQARRFAKALQTQGVDARVLYAEGYGGTHLVVGNSLNWDNDNYRIEITLEKQYV